MQLKVAIDMFLNMQELAPSTRRVYKSVLYGLAEQLGFDVLVPNLQRTQVVNVLSQRQKNTTARHNWQVFASFYIWLQESYPGHLEPLIPRFVIKRVNPELAIQEDKISALLAAERNLRNQTIIRFMADTGMDAYAITQLKQSDVQGSLVIALECGYRQTMYIGEQSIQSLNKWLLKHPGGNWLFCSSRGEQLSTAAVRLILHRAAKTARLGKINLEGFYHRKGVKSLASSQGIPDLERILMVNAITVT